MEVWAIVPARLGSRRVAAKVLQPIQGRPMIVHVLDRAAQADVQRVILATDDDEVAKAGRDAGHEVVRTGDARTGTHRCWLALQALGGHPDAVVNVQGDQPLLEPLHVDVAVGMLGLFDVGTVSAPLQDAGDPSRVKVVTTHRNGALYFSRAAIPHGGPHRVHVGIYAFTPESLSRCVVAPREGLALSEDLEQLAWLQEGITIGVAPVERSQHPVDDDVDLERVRVILER